MRVAAMQMVAVKGDVAANLGMIAVLCIGGHRVLDGDMSYGQMLEFMQYIAMVVAPLRSLGMTVAFGQRAAAALIPGARLAIFDTGHSPHTTDPDGVASEMLHHLDSIGHGQGQEAQGGTR